MNSTYLTRPPRTAAQTYEAYGVRFGVRVSDPRVLQRVPLHLPPGARTVPGADAPRWYTVDAEEPSADRWRLSAGPRRLLQGGTLDDALETLESDLQLHVAELAVGAVFVHAGVVCHGGRALVFPGRSFSGKSRLVQALVSAGATYFSDEYAVLDALGRVHPYPRRLSLRQADGRSRRRCTAAELGGRCGEGPAPIGLVAFVQYRQSAQWRPEALSPGRALLALLNHTVSIQANPEQALPALRAAVDGPPVLVGLRGEAESFAKNLLAQVTAS